MCRSIAENTDTASNWDLLVISIFNLQSYILLNHRPVLYQDPVVLSVKLFIVCIGTHFTEW